MSTRVKRAPWVAMSRRQSGEAVTAEGKDKVSKEVILRLPVGGSNKLITATYNISMVSSVSSSGSSSFSRHRARLIDGEVSMMARQGRQTRWSQKRERKLDVSFLV